MSRDINVPLRYIPKRLSKKDKKIQKKELLRSRKAYKKGKYYTRKRVKSFKSTVSKHILKARKIYKINSIKPSKKLSKKTGCSLTSLKKIVNKGKGAYFSSGSRPNQTAESWGIARLASSITGGKASAIDLNILQKGCNTTSKALKMAIKTKKKIRRVPKIKL